MKGTPLDDGEAVELLTRLVEAYAPSGREEPVARLLVEFFEGRGVRCERDGVGNVLAAVGSGSPHLLLSSHMDTIPGELPFEATNEVVKGRGAVDCRPALAAMAVATVNFSRQFPEGAGRVTFAGVVREEDSLEGILHFFQNHPEAPDFAVFGEPTRVDRLCVAYKGRVWVRLKVTTETGHVAACWKYKNAIEEFFAAWEAIRRACGEHRGASPFYQVTPTLATVSGGRLSNAVPAECSGDVDLRIPPQVDAERFRDRVDEVLNSLAAERGVEVERSYESVVPGYRAPAGHPAVRAFVEAIGEATGSPGKLLRKTGTCFTNLIGYHYGVPCVTYGAGDPRLEHTDREEVEVGEYLRSIATYGAFFSKFFAGG
ncbi:MAG: [LysW]-lysine hydrolase [Promethearchaeota archaeon]